MCFPAARDDVTLRSVEFLEHPLRRELVREMHLRRFAPVAAPASLVQMVSLVEEELREAETTRLTELARTHGGTFDPEARHAMIALNENLTFLWERHTEATTLTVISHEGQSSGFEEASKWLLDWPGVVVRATKIFVERDAKRARKLLPEMEFETEDLVCCAVNAGVTIWSDFRIRDDGFGRLLLTAGDARPGELGRIIQRLQELGNYRNLALLGLPEVRRLMPELSALEARLAEESAQLGEDNRRGDDQLLSDLSLLSAELARIRVASGYRLSASGAYAQIAMDRLESLCVRPHEGYQDLTEFTERRLVPGMRTCESFVERLRRLSERSGDAIALLNTRIDTRIKAQNLDLLRSMESSFNLQLRLQNLVEALSVIAASYYFIGLVAYVLKGAAAFPDGDRIDLALAIATPIVVLAMYLLVGQIRKRVIGETEGAAKSSSKD